MRMNRLYVHFQRTTLKCLHPMPKAEWECNKYLAKKEQPLTIIKAIKHKDILSHSLKMLVLYKFNICFNSLIAQLRPIT
jgi:hypothetical protein